MLISVQHTCTTKYAHGGFRVQSLFELTNSKPTKCTWRGVINGGRYTTLYNGNRP